MSMITAGPLTRRPLGSWPPSQFPHETASQQVPTSPLSPFFSGHPCGPTSRPGQRGVLCSPSSGSPLAQVPDGGSPLLRQLLDCRKRRRDDSTPSPSPASKRSSRDSPRVPNSIIIVRRTAPPSSKEEQVVPSIPSPQLESSKSDGETRNSTSHSLAPRKLPQVSDNTKLLDLFGLSGEIFANSREE